MAEMTFIEFFQKGGILMYPLTLCGLVAIAFIVERALFFLDVMVPRAYLDGIREKILNGDYEGAMSRVQERKGPIPNVLMRGLEHLSEYEFHQGRRIADFERYMREAIISEMVRVGRNNGWIGIIANVGPLLGLLGTVMGLLDTFLVLEKLGRPEISQLSGGIGVALITTVMGLFVGIPASFAHDHFNLRADDISQEMERISVEMANAITHARSPEVGEIEVGVE